MWGSKLNSYTRALRTVSWFPNYVVLSRVMLCVAIFQSSRYKQWAGWAPKPSSLLVLAYAKGFTTCLFVCGRCRIRTCGVCVDFEAWQLSLLVLLSAFDHSANLPLGARHYKVLYTWPQAFASYQYFAPLFSTANRPSRFAIQQMGLAPSPSPCAQLFYIVRDASRYGIDESIVFCRKVCVEFSALPVT